ncbi:MAG: hypothetical protein RR107_05765 [Clostridia bacterium]
MNKKQQNQDIETRQDVVDDIIDLIDENDDAKIINEIEKNAYDESDEKSKPKSESDDGAAKVEIPSKQKTKAAKNAIAKSFDERDKGFSIMVNGSDDELVEYFAGLGVSKDEILTEKNALVQMAKDELFARDLEELQNEFEFLTAKTIQEIPNFEKFAKLRASGLSAIESFEGASGKLISMEYLKNRDSGSYSHLKSSGLKGSAAGDVPIPKDELGIWKSAFPKDNLTALTKRYNKTKFQKGA